MNKFRLATALFAAALASAQPGMMRRSDPIVAALDTDQDRTISPAELGKAAVALATLDANKDGQLSADEIRPPSGGGRPGFGREGRAGGPRGSGGDATASGDRLKTLMAFDANGDGQLAKSEVPARMQGLFTRGDKNNDGVLTAAELQALVAAEPRRDNQGPPPAMMDPVRAALDTDHDGVISTAEMSAASTSLAKLDRNSDGMLTEDELRPIRGGRGGPRGNPEEMYKHLLEENDANGDGKLAVSELPDRMREFMGNADSNKDGFISQEEMMSARPQGGPGGPRGRREE